MQPDLLNIINCPARDCGSPDLRVEVSCLETLEYRVGPVEEIREGAIHCDACGRAYPIEEYVPSFSSLFPGDLREEADYWGRWYGFFWDRGYRGFFDLRSPSTPYITHGVDVPDPRSLTGKDRHGTHAVLANDPAVSSAQRVLDVGCGGGWSSLYLARRGHCVVAFDPNAENVRRAKRHAIEQGEHIEYLATGLGFLDFKPEVFDAVFALHSIHHVPDLPRELRLVRGWMREGAALAVDEHVHTDPFLVVLLSSMRQWFERDVAPRFATLDLAGLNDIQQVGASRLEDAGSEELLGALSDSFLLEKLQTRFVTLDLFSYMFYLSRDKDLDAYDYAAETVHTLYGFLKDAYPGRAEYAMVIGRKTGCTGPSTPEIAQQLELLARVDTGIIEGLPENLPPDYLGRLERLWSENAEAREEIRRLSTLNSERQSELSRISSLHSEARDEIARLSGHCTALERGVNELHSAIQTGNRHIRALQEAVAIHENSLSHATQAISALQKTLEVQSGTMRAKEEQVANASQALSELQRTVDALNADVRAKNEYIIALQEMLARHEAAPSEKDAFAGSRSAYTRRIESGRVKRILKNLDRARPGH